MHKRPVGSGSVPDVSESVVDTVNSNCLTTIKYDE